MLGMTVVIPMSIAVGSRVNADEPERGGAPAATAAAPTVERFLLLSNGQIVQGVVSSDGASYQVVQRVGAVEISQETRRGRVQLGA